jgi:hypothetical protein
VTNLAKIRNNRDFPKIIVKPVMPTATSLIAIEPASQFAMANPCRLSFDRVRNKKAPGSPVLVIESGGKVERLSVKA